MFEEDRDPTHLSHGDKQLGLLGAWLNAAARPVWADLSLRASRPLLERVRGAFWLLAVGAGLALGAALTPSHRFQGLFAIGLLLGWWSFGLRRRGFPLWALPLEGCALAALQLVSEGPAHGLFLTTAALSFRALYGSRRRVVGVVAAYSSVQLVVLLPTQPPYWQFAAPLAAIGWAGCAAVCYGLAREIEERDRRSERDDLFGAATAWFVTAVDRPELYRIAVNTLLALVALPGKSLAAVATEAGDGLRVLASAGGIGEGDARRAHLTEAAAEAGRRAAHGQREVYVQREAEGGAPADSRMRAASIFAQPIVFRNEVREVLVIECDGALPADVRDAIARLASELLLILARMDQEDLLRRKEAQFSALVRQSSDVIAFLDDEGVVRYVSPSVEEVLGYRREAIVGLRLTAILAGPWIHRSDRAAIAEDFGELARAGAGQMRTTCRIRARKAGWRWLEIAANQRVSDPEIRGSVLNLRDVTVQVRLQQQLYDQARHDPLTGVANRALLEERFTEARIRAQRTGAPVAIVLLDLDNFKGINDNLGHEAGDRVLVDLVSRLKHVVRAAETLARIGGDEFALLLEGADEDSALRVAERVLGTLAEPFDLRGRRLRVEASIGFALSAKDATLAELLRRADAAMYRAKAEGKGHVRSFEAMKDDLVVGLFVANSALQGHGRPAITVAPRSAVRKPPVSVV